MRREFIYTSIFLRQWDELKLNDNDLHCLENIILTNPHAGVVIPRLSGARKLRFALEGRGKSGGVRVIYVDLVIDNHVYMLLVYPKNAQTNITAEQEKKLQKIINELKEV